MKSPRSFAGLVTQTACEVRIPRFCHLALRQNFTEKCKHCLVELIGSLERCEVAHTVQINQSRIWNVLSEIFGVFTLDEFIMLTMYDYNWYTDLEQIIRRIIWLRPLHQPNRLGKLVELIRRGR
jgi:hypothetical protein